RERLRPALAVRDAELELHAALDGDARGNRRGMEEDLLAVIGADEAEALLVVIELDLAGGHVTTSFSVAARVSADDLPPQAYGQSGGAYPWDCDQEHRIVRRGVRHAARRPR